MIDTHAHLNFPQLAGDLAGVLERADAAGVHAIIVPATGVETSTSSIELSKKYPNVFSCVGIHPSDVNEEWREQEQALRGLLEGEAVVTSIGEVGLDYYHFEDVSSEAQKAEKIAQQQAAFRAMIDLAKEVSLPLIIHSREAFTDVRNILAQEATNHPTVIHCFTGSKEEAFAWLDLGFHLSFTGILTYKKSAALREVAKEVPMDRIMIETDAPYLSPEGYRNELCEPRHVVEVAKCLAEVKGVSLEEIDLQTTATSQAFFSLSK